MTSRIFAFAFLILSACAAPEKGGDATQQFNDFIAEFTAVDKQDKSLGDKSTLSFTNELEETRNRLVQLRNIDTTQLSGDDRIDWKFAQSILVGQELELNLLKPWTKNPRDYMVFTRISMAMDKPGDLNAKIKEVKQRLELVPTQLGNGQAQIEVYVPRFQELSVFMAENGRVLFEKEIPAFLETLGEKADALTGPAEAAAQALENYITFLKEELPKKPEADFAIGTKNYNEMLEHQFLVPYDADSLWEVGWVKFNETVAQLEELAKKIDPNKTWQQVALELKSEYPEPDQIIPVSQEWVDKSRDHVKANNLIPIPWPERVNVVERAEYLRKTSYYGHFSSAKQKDSEGIFTSEMVLNPYEEQWDEKQKKEFMEEHDWGVIIVTAPHETYAGHHVQGLYQLHNPRPLRKENGVSMFSEGWGLYNEQLMRETGFFTTDKILLRQLQLRLWRNARVIYDCGMHSGKMTYDDAIDLMTNKVGFLRWASQLEVDASSARPGYFIGYFMGMTEILKMREEYKAKMGDQFTLSDFHERLLKIGNMPPSLMREALFLEQ